MRQIPFTGDTGNTDRPVRPSGKNWAILQKEQGVGEIQKLRIKVDNTVGIQSENFR